MESIDEKSLLHVLAIPSQEVTWGSIAFLSALSAGDFICNAVG